MRMLALAASFAVAAAATPVRANDEPYADLDLRYEAFVQAEHIPGLVYGVVKDGKLVHLRTIGLANLDTQSPVAADTAFRIASMSKGVLALAVLALRDDGKLSLDDSVSLHLPGFRDPPSTTDSRPITIRDLLGHLAGFVTDDPWGDRQLDTTPTAFTHLIRAGWPSATPPRTHFEYSNLGYALLGRIITNVAGEPYQNYVAERLFVPLGMASTTYDRGSIRESKSTTGYRWSGARWAPEPVLGDGEFGAMGGLWTTALDYARWVRFLLAAWPARDGADEGPVKRATVRELAIAQGVPQVQAMTNGEGAACSVAQAYSYGMIVGSGCGIGRFVQHSGGLPGYGSNVLLIPDAGIGLFVFANRTYAPTFRVNLSAATALIHDPSFALRTSENSPELQTVVEGALAAYAVGRIQRMAPLLANNVLLDRTAGERDAELAALRLRHGECRLGKITPTHRLRAAFMFECERGSLSGQVVLAPTPTPHAQVIEFGAP